MSVRWVEKIISLEKAESNPLVVGGGRRKVLALKKVTGSILLPFYFHWEQRQLAGQKIYFFKYGIFGIHKFLLKLSVSIRFGHYKQKA